MFRLLAVSAVEVVSAHEAADTAHGPAGIGEEGGAEVQVSTLHRREEKTQLMTPEQHSQWLHLQDRKYIIHIKHRECC